MAYERLNLKKDDLLDEAVFKRIDDGIATIHNDLYDDKVAVEWETTYSSIPDITKPVYEKEWATAVLPVVKAAKDAAAE